MPDITPDLEKPRLVLPEAYRRDLATVNAYRTGLVARGHYLPHAWVAEQIDRSEQNVCSTLTGAIHSPGTLRLLAVLFEDLDAGRVAAPRRGDYDE